MSRGEEKVSSLYVKEGELRGDKGKEGGRKA